MKIKCFFFILQRFHEKLRIQEERSGHPMNKAVSKSMSNVLSKQEVVRLQKYLQGRFSNGKVTLTERKEAKDSAEVMLNGEFIGVIYRDEDEGEVSYDFNMAILDMDLPPA